MDSPPEDRLAMEVTAAEQAAIGCLLSDGPISWPLFHAMGVTRRWFADERHGDILDLARHLAANGMGIDTLTILAAAQDRGNSRIDPLLLESLACTVGTTVMLETYLAQLHARLVRREAREAAQRLQRLAEDPQASPEAMTDAIAVIHEHFRGRTSKSDGGFPPIVDCTALISRPPEKPAELVYGLLHQGCKLVLGSGSKSFKTWCLLDLAISVSHGEPWLGFKTAKGRVLYLNLEIQAWAFRDRIQSIASAKHIALHGPQLDIWNLRGHAAAYSAVLPRIKEAVQRSGYSLIVLDPVYKLLGDLDENSAGDMGKLMNEIESLAVESGAAVAFGAHFSKGNQARKDSIDRISGSGVFARDPDSILVMTRHAQEGAFTVEATLRNFKPVEPFVARWDFPLFRRDSELDPGELKQQAARNPARKYTPEQLLEVLNGQKMSTTEWQKAVMTETGMSERTFKYQMKAAVKLGNLTKDRKGQWFTKDQCNECK